MLGSQTRLLSLGQVGLFLSSHPHSAITRSFLISCTLMGVLGELMGSGEGCLPGPSRGASHNSRAEAGFSHAVWSPNERMARVKGMRLPVPDWKGSTRSQAVGDHVVSVVLLLFLPSFRVLCGPVLPLCRVQASLFPRSSLFLSISFTLHPPPPQTGLGHL